MKKNNQKQLKLMFADKNRFVALLSVLVRRFFCCQNYIFNILRTDYFGRKV